jgi:hypothetical protein
MPMKMSDIVHRWENGRIAWSATLRYAVACLLPFWDGDAPGRAYTPAEKSRRNRAEGRRP